MWSNYEYRCGNFASLRGINFKALDGNMQGKCLKHKVGLATYDNAQKTR